MNRMIKYMLNKQAKDDCEERGGDPKEHGFSTTIRYVESIESLVLNIAIAKDEGDDKKLDESCNALIELCTAHNHFMC